jgi:2,5-furandicarboxylate decarboxylase 1
MTKVSRQSLRRHLDDLAAAGRLQVFNAPVDVDANVSALSYRAYVERGKACLFTDPSGFPGWEVASQLVMDRSMWAIALGLPEAQVVDTFAQRLRRLVPPVMVTDAPVQEIVETGDALDLMKLPAMWTSDRDPGRYIASGMCIIKDPETGIRNMSVHRAQILGRNTTGYYMLPRQAMRIHQMHQKLGRPMEAAMVIGGHPLIMFASAFVAPFGTDELAIAGGLLGEPVRLVKCKTIDIEVPADAELVLEGEILPDEISAEGPFGEVTGTYSKVGTAPVFRVKAITRRRKPVFYAMSCGMAPSDAHSITCAVVEAKLSEHLRGVDGGLVELADIRCPGGMSPLIVALRMRPRYAGQAKTALVAAASSPYLHPKLLVAVDDDIDISDPWQVLRALSSRFDAAADLTRIDRTRVFTLDNASPLDPGVDPMHRTGTKALFDATLDPRMDAAERSRYAWVARPAGRAEWARALGVQEEGFVFTMRDRSETRVEPADTPAPSLRQTRLDALPSDNRQIFTGVLVLGETLCLVRALRSGEVLQIALDTPRLAMLLARRQRARLVIGPSAGLMLAAAIGTLGGPADYALAGALAGKPVPLVGSAGLPYPADARALIDGEIDPAAPSQTGAIPGIAGYAGVTLDTVRFTYDACRSVQPGEIAPLDVTSAMAVASEILTARHLRTIEGGLDLRDVHCPPQAGGLVTIVQLAPRVAGQAKTALLAALSGPSTLARLAIAVDPDVCATDPAELTWALASRVHPQSDIGVIEGAGGPASDAMAQPVGGGAARSAKWIYDATIPLGGTGGEGAEAFARATPKNLAAVRLPPE